MLSAQAVQLIYHLVWGLIHPGGHIHFTQRQQQEHGRDEQTNKQSQVEDKEGNQYKFRTIRYCNWCCMIHYYDLNVNLIKRHTDIQIVTSYVSITIVRSNYMSV